MPQDGRPAHFLHSEWWLFGKYDCFPLCSINDNFEIYYQVIAYTFHSACVFFSSIYFMSKLLIGKPLLSFEEKGTCMGINKDGFLTVFT